MSISGSLSNALSGLTAASRAAEVVSSNLSNAMTDGYGRRVLEIVPRSIGAAGGVEVVGISRSVDAGTIGDRRLADAEYQHAETIDQFQMRMVVLLGSPEDGQSLSARLAEFENALVVAASRPDSNERLKMVSQRAAQVSDTLNAMSDGIQKLRNEADQKIASDVENLNLLLTQVRDLNLRISGAHNQGKETAALEDHRQRVIDQVSEIVPIREVARDRGSVALFTTGGAILLDGTAAELAFTTTNVIMPHMTEAAGLLSGLTINDVPVRVDSEHGPLRGGRLGALFQIRDEIAVEMQAQTDAVARDLIERFQDSGVDPSLAVTDAGLFTDGSGQFESVDEVGISGRIALNTLVDADTGDMWRLRAGLSVVSPGDVGDATLLIAMSAALTDTRVPLSGSFGTAARSASDLVARLVTQVSSNQQLSEQNMAFSTSRLSNLTAMELEDGVDSDQEMQQLMLIEQSYAANARVIETVDEMMEQLLRL